MPMRRAALAGLLAMPLGPAQRRVALAGGAAAAADHRFLIDMRRQGAAEGRRRN